MPMQTPGTPKHCSGVFCTDKRLSHLQDECKTIKLCNRERSLYFSNDNQRRCDVHEQNMHVSVLCHIFTPFRFHNTQNSFRQRDLQVH